MKAITYSSYGGPENLTLSEVEEPKLGPAEVRIGVRAASVNPVDWKVMSGGLDPLLTTTFPVIPGWDVAGVVEAVGLDAPEFAVGDEIMAYARKDWIQQGSFAEKMTVPVRTAARKPASLSFEQAASLPLAGLTAWQTLTRLGVSAGDTVLVHGANGGVGSFAVQIAAALGARVIGTASERNHDRLRALGAEPVAYGDGLADRVRALAPEGADVVVDYVGGVLEQTLAVLADGGRHASIADPTVAGAGGAYMWVRPDAADLARLAELVEAGSLRVDVARTFPLEQAADAFRASMEGHTAGKIALSIGE
ncbi:NADP-dependent oxidoreductase [Brachybacterium aquaticum]|uniref:NADPH:quinone reductase-like Zn-dependent oxidoreductase n=1 Tax=Brachybacterium aquaticum TaxID=1432564 RepID=A0A841ACT6_9MICO|nr:NADP-dependent oxidoreductase [Brachybacterium aquaticum]MBB5833079.1 NADPH:quinone reductase-like Zn-dependent oxidoreductase [Brachybacterium aquaticum]